MTLGLQSKHLLIQPTRWWQNLMTTRMKKLVSDHYVNLKIYLTALYHQQNRKGLREGAHEEKEDVEQTRLIEYEEQSNIHYLVKHLELFC